METGIQYFMFHPLLGSICARFGDSFAGLNYLTLTNYPLKYCKQNAKKSFSAISFLMNELFFSWGRSQMAYPCNLFCILEAEVAGEPKNHRNLAFLLRRGPREAPPAWRRCPRT